MNTLLVLPLLFVACLSADDVWHGVEYTYKIHASSVHENEKTGEVLSEHGVSNIFKCRPLISDTLNCRSVSHWLKYNRRNLTSSTEHSAAEWEMGEEPFQVVFDKNGIGELVVTERMPPWVIGGLRLIVAQLNNGFNISKKPVGTFTAMEKSYMGECETTVKVTRKSTEAGGLWKQSVLKATPMPGFEKAIGEVVEIVKWRNLEKCANKVDYFSGIPTPFPNSYESTMTKLTTSFSHIFISDTDYRSYTINEIIVTSTNSDKNVKVIEKITLMLISAMPDNNQVYSTTEKLSTTN